VDEEKMKSRSDSSRCTQEHYPAICLVGWSLTSLFSTNTAISEKKGQTWRVILLPSEGRLL